MTNSIPEPRLRRLSKPLENPMQIPGRPTKRFERGARLRKLFVEKAPEARGLHNAFQVLLAANCGAICQHCANKRKVGLEPLTISLTWC